MAARNSEEDVSDEGPIQESPSEPKDTEKELTSPVSNREAKEK
jgi:hypothetical protein